MPKTDAFDKYSDEYDAWFDSHRDAYSAELETIRQLIPSTQAIGMEVGVGSGKFAVPLGIKIGVEPSASMASKAKKLGINVYPGVAEDLPFADGEFNYVLMVTTICFVDDVAQSLREALRVLKTGGHLILGLIDKESELGRHYLSIKDEDKFYKEATFFSTDEVLQYLLEVGFTSACIKQTLIPGESPDCIMDGYGKGAFVAIRGTKVG